METNKHRPLYMDPGAPRADRIEDLIGRMTLAEKVSQMTNQARAIPRLGIPAYDFWSEGLHGVARNGRATVFPQAIGLAATWDMELIHQVASAIADEARAKHRVAVEKYGASGQYQGLTLWSPNVNIFRDPRWGRGQETWGEDPYLTGEMAASFVRGLQGDDPDALKVAACAKHYAVHSGPEKLRHGFDARPSRQDLAATYLPAFEKLVTEAKVEAVMGSYNRLYGVPACASPLLLGDILRKEWGFEGHVVSDCWALSNMHGEHGYTRNAVESAAVALRAGCDLACMCTFDRLDEAVAQGLIEEADIDRALRRTLATRFKLGMFDPAGHGPYASIPIDVINSPAHQELAYQAALESIVLLKNRDGILPIRSEVKTITVVGPTAASLDVLLGNYYGVSDRMTTLLEGIVSAAPEEVRIDYHPGCPLTGEVLNKINWSVFTAAGADLTIACMGLSPMLEGEEGESILTRESGDRETIELPPAQVDYLNSLVDLGAKVVLVLTGGSPIALGDLAEKVYAVVYVGYPGQEGGRALASILFGQAAPSGKLPVTFPQSTSQLPPFEDYAMAGRTYRYMTAEPLYPFGFGLSTTCFQYHHLVLERSRLDPGESLRLQVTLDNQGRVDGQEVVQVYLKDLEASTTTPIYSLVAFERLRLAAGESRLVKFEIPAERMILVDEQGKRQLEPGDFEVVVGGCSPGERGRALGAPEPVQAVFSVEKK